MAEERQKIAASNRAETDDIFMQHSYWVYDVSPIAQVPDNLFPDKSSPITKSPIDPTPRQAQVPDYKPNPNSPIAQVPDCLSPRLPKSPITRLPDNQIPDRPNSPTSPTPRL